MTPTTTTMTANVTVPTPAGVYLSQGERALARGTHSIEESIWVYLMRDWDGIDRWVLDPVTVDCCGLDSGLENGARNSECMCEDRTGCDAVRDRTALPSADDLLHLLAESLGYTVTRVARR
ncbi:hypothetical protein P3H15_36180 [Rhodococcus sp. T2V]|uniref:hypothetical protein n=1 Tax=Rhodococcus sp. T2V TaxID=3034164 RepID=UPI0023E3309F|nr:hypothetical protein [Rhodococcus sp. T2V]MDF3310458.1 hypothetical protein [Rhodococcus sp. T2V]